MSSERLSVHERRLNQLVFSRIAAAEAQRDPARVAFVFENGEHPVETLTTGGLVLAGDKLAAALRAAGLRRGDRVAVMLRNHPEFLISLAANATLALPTVPVDPRSRGDKLAYFLGFAECAALITADYVVADPAAAEVIRASGVRTFVLSTPEGRATGLDVNGWPSLNEILEGPEAPGSANRSPIRPSPGCWPTPPEPPEIRRRSSSATSAWRCTEPCPDGSAITRTTSPTPDCR